MMLPQTKSIEISWEELCERGRRLTNKEEHYRWRLGDLGKHIDRTYRDKGIEEFAKEIGKPKSSVYQYAKVSSMFPKILRRRILDDCPNLTYTYFRDSLRLKDRHEAVKWLYEVSALGITCDEAARRLTEKLGRKTIESIPGIIENIFERDGKGIIEIAIAPEDLEFITKQMAVNIKTKAN